MIRGEGVGETAAEQQNGGTEVVEVITGAEGGGVIEVCDSFGGAQFGREPAGERDVPLAGGFHRREQ